MSAIETVAYEKRGDKWVFCKDGVYFAMTFDQVHEMNALTDRIIREETDAMLGGAHMKDKILIWFATGRVGTSSKAMAYAALGIDSNERDHPYDPSDFNRCLLLLEEVPEIRLHFDKVAAISDTWARLIARWDEVEKCFIDEVGRDWCNARSAPKTYDLMKAIGC